VTWKPYGQLVVLRIDGVAPSGEGTGTLEETRYKVFGALPGERVAARIFARRKGWRLAELEEILEPSPHRVDARCPVFGTCGGCSWQSLAYEEQPRLLEMLVRTAFAEAGAVVPDGAWRETIPAARRLACRGKIELTFGGEPGDLILGFNRRGRFDRLVNVDECFIGPEVNRPVIAATRDWANRRGHAAYHPRRHEGFLRYLVIRQAHDSWLVGLVTTTPPTEDWGAGELADAIGRIPGSGSLVHVVSNASAQAVRVEDLRVLRGTGAIEAALAGVRYSLTLESFFQANLEMAERLVQVVRERAALTGTEKVLDLYCGVGTIALALAPDAAHVTGVEAVAAAIEDAKRNALGSGRLNTTFRVEAAERHVWAEDTDLIVLDPPRSGLHPRLVRRLLKQPVPRILYVSCNPRALAAHLAELQGAYEPVFCQCLDLFPQTPHVETVVELKRSMPIEYNGSI